MRCNDVLGVIFSNSHDILIRELTDIRTMGSVPIGGRYRMIDFPLSNMVNSGIKKVGVITKSNYSSLMDHLGSGKPWDLARKRGGLSLLPPYGHVGTGIYKDRIDALQGAMQFLIHSSEKYVLLSDADVIYNFSFEDLLDKHIDNGADITTVYKYGREPNGQDDTMVYELDGNSRVTSLRVCPGAEENCNFGLDIFLMEKEFLIHMINEAVSMNKTSFVRDLLQSNLTNMRIFGYEAAGYSAIIDSMQSYFQANMELLSADVRAELFDKERPIYTKIRDEVPAKYGLGSHVVNSLVADGCIIDGRVENCVLFRGVKIGRDSAVSNSVIMQSTNIGTECKLDHVISDKNARIKDGRTLMGFSSYPVFIRKNSVV
ncbi:MAG TPA: glucose-1-phosphate adenylyltransferase subunit GlgD [Ruminococcaceae bacterium]|nr:glucose-1-phosphate adenylyltransferase subunit GlgD [Oscillospiraceae bacterium]